MNKVSKSKYDWISREMPDLIGGGYLDAGIADRLLEHFRSRLDDGSMARTVIVAILSGLGGVFVMMGIILMLGHNWDDLPKNFRLACSMLPLLIGQAIGLWVILKGKSMAWRETISPVISLALLAATALVAQIYQITGDGRTIFLVTAVLSLPMVYLFNSVGGFIIYLALASAYGIGCWSAPQAIQHELFLPYCFLWAAVIPFIVMRLRRGGVATMGGFWIRSMIAIAAFIGVITTVVCNVVDGGDWFVLFALVFCILYLLGRWLEEQNCKIQFRVWLAIGKFIPAVCLLIGILVSVWLEFDCELSEIICFSFLGFCWLVCLVANLYRKDVDGIVNGCVFCLAALSYVSSHLVLAGVLGLGGYHLITGLKKNSFGALNWGVFLIASGLISEIFNYKVDFIIRGLLLIAVGILFFCTNWWMLRRRKLTGRRLAI